jgi:hypothetical protein
MVRTKQSSRRLRSAKRRSRSRSSATRRSRSRSRSQSSHECAICYEMKSMFIQCPHCRNEVCTDCYPQMENKCPFCRGLYVLMPSIEEVWMPSIEEVWLPQPYEVELRPRYYTHQDREDAVGLAHIIGVRAASEELDIPEFLIRSWMG